MNSGFEFECPICKFQPENGNDLEEHLISKHQWPKDKARQEQNKQRKKLKEYYK